MKKWMSLIFMMAILVPDMLIAGDKDQTLSVWAPAPGRSHYRDSVSMSFLKKLEAVTERRVIINGTEDREQLEKACATYAADHLLVSGYQASKLVKQYGYRIIAYGDTPMAIYAKKSDLQSLDDVQKLGFFRGTHMDVLVNSEISDIDLSEAFISFGSDREGVEALFKGEIDALVMSRKKISQLASQLRSQLRILTQLETPGTMAIMVSPRLEPELQRRLQNLYLSDDPFIVDLFVNKAGLRLNLEPLPL